MRAIEEGRYLVRAANTGISGIVDPYGRVLERTGIYQPAVVVGDVRLLTAATLYSRSRRRVRVRVGVATLALVLLFRTASRRVQ